MRLLHRQVVHPDGKFLFLKASGHRYD